MIWPKLNPPRSALAGLFIGLFYGLLAARFASGRHGIHGLNGGETSGNAACQSEANQPQKNPTQKLGIGLHANSAHFYSPSSYALAPYKRVRGLKRKGSISVNKT